MRYSLVFVLCALFCAAVASVAFINALPLNPARLQLSFVKETFTLIPQGWAFFTRSPREAQVLLYAASPEAPGRLTPVKHQHAAAYNAFGLNRRSTQIMSELQMIKSKLADSLFITTNWNYQRGLYGPIPDKAVEVENIMGSQLLCGEYVLVFQEVIPWAWASSMDKIKMPAKAIKLNVVCTH